jgi:hypothetical protein
MADYADYDYIIIRMYVTDANPLLYLKLGNNSGSDAWALDGQYNIAVGQWKNYVYPIEPFLAVFNKISDGIYDQERLWGQAGSSAEGAIYISSITVSNEQRPAPAPNEVESYDHPDSAYNALNWNTNSVEWLSEYQGESGVVKMTYSSVWLAWSFLPRQEMSAYEGYDYITIRMYVEDTDNPIKYFILGNDTGVDSEQIGGRNIATGQWQDYTFNIAPFLAAWHKIYDGNDYNERLWSQATNNNLGAIYISAIYVH